MGMLDDLTLDLPASPEFRWCYIIDKNGKRRLVGVSNEAMKALHKRLVALLEGCLSVSFESAFGGVSGRSAIGNALEHHRNRHFYVVDMKNAYRNLPISKLAQSIYYADRFLGSIDEIESFLVKYCTHESGGLVVGAHASPYLFNMYCALLLDPYVRMVTRGMTYTRYFDDLVISSTEHIPSHIRKQVRFALNNIGFPVNHRKSKLLDRKVGPVTITGYKIMPSGKITLPSKLMARAWSDLSDPEADLSGMNGCLFSIPLEYASNDVRGLRDVFSARLGVCKSKANPIVERKRSYSREYIDRLKANVNIASVIGRRVKLKKEGKEYSGLCPFHSEETPSFKVSPSKGFYHCFGCQAHGDAIEFLRLMGYSFGEAIKELQSLAGISE